MPYLSAILATFTWAIATEIFSYLGEKLSIFRLNLYKSIFSLGLFVIAALFVGHLVPTPKAIGLLLISGFLGFAMGDIFIFYSLTHLGAARTLMMAAFAPALVAIYMYLLLGTVLAPIKAVGLIFLIFCLFCLAKEKRAKKKFSWKVAGLGFFGIALDSLGVVFSKMAFMADPQLGTIQANMYRIAVAVVVLFALNIIRGHRLSIKDLEPKTKGLIMLSSFVGTFLALAFYLHAISKINPAIVVGLCILTPVYTAIYEHIRDRICPSRYFFAAVGFMVVGVMMLVF